MTFPEWTKPSIYGGLCGAMAVFVLGFTWGGWITRGNAQEMAENLASGLWIQSPQGSDGYRLGDPTGYRNAEP